MNRINWIDWAKCIAITMVVFGHIPQKEGNFLQLYICTFHIPLFFFISGYLTKTRIETKEELKKCTHSLIIPYILYNLIFYPYWAIRLYLDRNIDFSIYDYIIKPIIGLFLLQINTPISSSVNGAMWFVADLLIMRMIVHICLHTSKPLFFIKSIAILSIGIYAFATIQKLPFPRTIEELFECMPIYLLGYLSKQYQWIEKISPKRNFYWALSLICISVYASIINMGADSILYKIIILYIVIITATYGTIFLCKIFNSITYQVIINVSNGTLMIMGLHWMFIGTTNFILEHTLSMTDITYSWVIAIIFALCIDAVIYPFILLSKKHMPILLGK